MKKKQYYSIHDLLKIEISSDIPFRKSIFEDLNFPFSYFSVEELDEDPDIVLNIGEFDPSNNNCNVLDYKYNIKENYFFCTENIPDAKWSVEIKGLENSPTIINYLGNPKGIKKLFENQIPCMFILLPIIEYQLFKKGYHLIHAAGICKDKRGYILVGRPSSFKSSLAMDLIRKTGFQWLGDERVILCKDRVMSFPLCPDTFDLKCRLLNNENFPGLFSKLKFLYYSNRYNRSLSSLSIAKCVGLEKIIFISRSNKKNLETKELSREQGIKKLIENNRAEMMISQFYKYLLAYSFIFPDSMLSNYFKNFQEEIEKSIGNIPIFEQEIPEKYGNDSLTRVRDQL